MNFIKVPNLPVNNATAVLIDGRVTADVEKNLLKYGVRLIKTIPYKGVYTAISGHPDIFFHHVGDNTIVHAPGLDKQILAGLRTLGFNLIQGSTALSSRYPFDIAYNAARVGDFILHNLRYTDKVLMEELEKRNLKFINVNQGYTKCSIAVVDSCSIITSDAGISREAEKAGIEVLLIEPEEDIRLPGLDRGFIGGSTGMLGEKKLAFTGCLDNLKSKAAIVNFLGKKGVELISLSDGPIIDIGSILPLSE